VAAAALEAYILLRPSKISAPPPPARGVLRVGKLSFGGDRNAYPLAFTHLEAALNQLGLTLKIHEAALLPGDTDLVYYPLIYLHGRGTASFPEQDLAALRMHLDPGGGTLFADAACRQLVARIFPGNPLVPIPRDDELLSRLIGFDLSTVQYTEAAGGGRTSPQLEGVRINGKWTIVYSKYGIACALEPEHDGKCKGYVHEDASKIGANVLIYSTLP